MKTFEEIKKTPIYKLTPLEQFIALCYLGKEVAQFYENISNINLPIKPSEERSFIHTALCFYLDEHGKNLNDESRAKVRALIAKYG